MNTILIEVSTNGYLRCTHADGSTMTLQPHQLEDHLRANPMKLAEPKSWLARLFSKPPVDPASKE